MFIIFRSKVYLISNILSFYITEQGLEIVLLSGEKLVVSIARQRIAEVLKKTMMEAIEKHKSFDIDSALEKINIGL